VIWHNRPEGKFANDIHWTIPFGHLVKLTSDLPIGSAMIKQPMALAVLAVVAAACILIIAVIAARGSPSCMTMAEARAKYPRAHLYWHTLHHCWDNHAARVTRERKTNRAPIIDASGSLGGVHWYPRGFDTVAALEPPVIVSVIDYRWPGSNVLFDMDQIMEASR
jgi:hypothetical protein